jgi:enoyl-CoA hydratase
MSYQFLLVDVTDRIATVTINRPDKLNALNDQLVGELGAAFDELAKHESVGAVVLTGAGRAFVAGADIAGLAVNSAGEMHRLSRTGQEVFRNIERSKKPVIAAVNGFAFGGGCELALSCHLRIASEQARFGLPEVKLGLIPGYGGTQRLPRLVGRGRALQLILTGDPIDGAEAFRIGLVNAVVTHAALADAARSMALTMLKNGPLALAAAIEAVDGGLDRGLDDALTLEAKLFAQLGHTADMREGTKAFLEKRPAVFRGV